MLLVCYHKQDIFYYYRFNSVVIKDNNRKVYQHNCKERLKGEGLEVQKKLMCSYLYTLQRQVGIKLTLFFRASLFFFLKFFTLFAK